MYDKCDAHAKEIGSHYADALDVNVSMYVCFPYTDHMLSFPFVFSTSIHTCARRTFFFFKETVIEEIISGPSVLGKQNVFA